MREGKPLPLRPKVFETLLILIENNGRIVEKEEMMTRLWPDSFVEESNLTFNIQQLRKALGDNARDPVYIETVARRGYRFKFEVKEVLQESPLASTVPEVSLRGSSIENESSINSEIFFNALNASTIDDACPSSLQTVQERAAEQPAFSPPLVSSKTNGLIFFAACLCILIIATGLFFLGQRREWFWQTRVVKSETSAPILSSAFKSERLTNTGGVGLAVLSPDTKFVAYSNWAEDKYSLWLRNLATGENVPIVPPSEESYMGLAFSHNGDWLYFVRKPPNVQSTTTLYRVSSVGGIPTKITTHLQGWFSISPDERKISFVRCPYKDENYCSLMIADSDGTNEQTIVTRSRPIRIGDNQFSPDGKSIAFASGQSRNASVDFGLFEINIEKRTERALTAHKFFDIKQLDWLPDGSGLLLAATENLAQNFKIYQVSAGTGKVQVLTKDSGNYATISLNRAADKMIVTQIISNFRLYLSPQENPKDSKLLAIADDFEFTNEGRLVYSSIADGNSNIWISNLEATEQRQLTSDPAQDFTPKISPDGRYIFFTSNRSGSSQLWKMNVDGSNQTTITKQEGGSPIFITADGKWVFYQSALNRNLWKVSTEGGAEILVTKQRMWRPAIDSEGKCVAYFSQKATDQYEIVLMSIEDEKILGTFALANDELFPAKLVWSKDSDSLFYLMTGASRSLVWQQPLKSEKAKLYADLGNEEVTDFSFTPDGKSFAFVRGKWTHDAFLIKGLK